MGDITGQHQGSATLKRWLRGRGNSTSALITMARQFPKALPELRNALEILL